MSCPAIDYDQDGKASTDVYGQMGPCEKDNLLKFETNNKATEDEGATSVNL